MSEYNVVYILIIYYFVFVYNYEIYDFNGWIKEKIFYK